MAGREFHDGATDGLEALEPLDPEKIHSFSELLEAMRKTAFGGRRLGEAYETLAAMIEDSDCKVVLTLSGAMTIAKMGKIISTMIDRGMVQAIISTGALVAQRGDLGKVFQFTYTGPLDLVEGIRHALDALNTLEAEHRCLRFCFERRLCLEDWR